MCKYIFFILFLTTSCANAYAGPGMGLGFIVSIFAFIGSLILILFGVLYYPIKKFIINSKNKKKIQKK
tara:strand:+ start:1892 stop:2095 length:204 start_codon:yes stop_codon:yes gene_type:complete